MCCRHLNRSLPNREIFSGFGFLIPQFISDSSNRCIEKEMRSKRAKATSSFCLSPWIDQQCDYKPTAMCTRTDHFSCPGTWLHAALRQVFGSVFLLRPSLDSSLADQGKYSQRILWYSGISHELGKQQITLPYFISQARDGNKSLISRNKYKL